MKKPRLRLRRRPKPTAALERPRPGLVYTIDDTRYVLKSIAYTGDGGLTISLLDERAHRAAYWIG